MYTFVLACTHLLYRKTHTHSYMSGSFELLIEGHPLPVSMADSIKKPQRKIPIIVVEGESMAKNILHCSLPEISLSRVCCCMQILFIELLLHVYCALFNTER